LTKLVIRQLQNFENDVDYADNHLSAPTNTRKRGKLTDDDRAVTRRAAIKIEESDIKGAIRTLCSTETLVIPDKSILPKLSSLHPTAPTDRRHLTNDNYTSPPLHVNMNTVKTALQSFPGGSSGGPDGLRPQHLKDLLNTDDNSALLEAITSFINVILSGGTPDCLRPSLFGASLIALNKKNGGIRPIAVGFVWRRLAAKTCCSHVSARASLILSPRQLGFGVSGGAEAAAHATRLYLNDMTPDKVLIKVDFSNAFNTIRRDTILEAVANHFPELLTFACSAYQHSSNLLFGDFILSSSEGVQQGDPLGPLFFCIAVHELLLSIKSEFVVGYLDDFSFGDTADIACRDLIQLEQDAAKLGLLLNRKKCEAVGGSEKSTTLLMSRGVQLLQTRLEEASQLGSPLHQDGIKAAIDLKCHELQILCKRLTLLPKHDCLFLLRHAFSIPKLMYILRTAPCFLNDVLTTYDNTLRDTLSTTMNIDINDIQWTQATLPIWAGGLGIRSAVMLAPSAFLASAASTVDLVKDLLPSNLENMVDPLLESALSAWKQFAGHLLLCRYLGPHRDNEHGTLNAALQLLINSKQRQLTLRIAHGF
jgi:hypothetical protein